MVSRGPGPRGGCLLAWNYSLGDGYDPAEQHLKGSSFENGRKRCLALSWEEGKVKAGDASKPLTDDPTLVNSFTSIILLGPPNILRGRKAGRSHGAPTGTQPAMVSLLPSIPIYRQRDPTGRDEWQVQQPVTS